MSCPIPQTAGYIATIIAIVFKSKLRCIKMIGRIPQIMPSFKLFTKPGDVVLDPFMGSGTTIFVAQQMKRHSIGIELLPEYYEMVETRLHVIKEDAKK